MSRRYLLRMERFLGFSSYSEERLLQQAGLADVAGDALAVAASWDSAQLPTWWTNDLESLEQELPISKARTDQAIDKLNKEASRQLIIRFFKVIQRSLDAIWRRTKRVGRLVANCANLVADTLVTCKTWVIGVVGHTLRTVGRQLRDIACYVTTGRTKIVVEAVLLLALIGIAASIIYGVYGKPVVIPEIVTAVILVALTVAALWLGSYPSTSVPATGNPPAPPAAGQSAHP